MKTRLQLLLFVSLAWAVEPTLAQGIGGDAGEEEIKARQKSENLQRGQIPGMFLADMDEANYMITQNAYRSAIDKLNLMLEEVRFGREWSTGKEYGAVNVLMMLGYVHALLDEVDVAIDYYEQVLASPLFDGPSEIVDPDRVLQRLYQDASYTMINLIAQKEDYRRAIELLHTWIAREEEPFADAFMFMGNLYAAVEQYEEALSYMDEALSRADEPREGWHRSTLSVLLQLEKHPRAVAILKTMIGHWPDRPTYWETLAQLHANEGDTQLALDTMMSAHTNGMVDNRYRVMMLVQLSVANEVPYEGAIALEGAMDSGMVEENQENLDVLIDTWTYAREYDRAIAAIERIANYTDASSHYLNAARLYLQSAEWQNAVDSGQKALAAGIGDKGRVLTIIGMANLELREYEKSLAAFRQILNDGNSREKVNAQHWIDFVEEARNNRELLSAAQ